MILDRSHTVDIEDWHVVVLVLLEHFLVPWLFPHVAEPNRLEHLERRQRGGDELTGMRSTSQEDGRLLSAHDLGVCQVLVAEVARVLLLRLVIVAKSISDVFRRIHDKVIISQLD